MMDHDKLNHMLNSAHIKTSSEIPLTRVLYLPVDRVPLVAHLEALAFSSAYLSRSDHLYLYLLDGALAFLDHRDET